MSINQTEHLKFLKFHSNPEELQSKDLESLIEWETKYPYCQSLKILAVKASEKTSQQSSFLAQAAASLPDRGVLYRFIHDIAHFQTDISQLSEESTTVAPANYEPMETMTAFGINLNEIVGAEFRESSPQLVEEPEEEISSEETREEVLEETPIEDEEEIVSEEDVLEVEEEAKPTEEVEPELPVAIEEEISSEETREEVINESPNEDEVVSEETFSEVEEEVKVTEEVASESPVALEEEILPEETQEEVIEETPTEVEEIVNSDETVLDAEEETKFTEEVESESPVAIEDEISPEETQEEVVNETPTEVKEEVNSEEAVIEVEEDTKVTEEVEAELPVVDIEEEISSEETQEETAKEVEEEVTSEETLSEVEVEEEEAKVTEDVESESPFVIEEEISSEETREEVIDESPNEDEVVSEETQEEVAASVEEEELVIDSPAQADFLAYAEKEPAKDIVEEEIQSENEVIDAKEDVTPYHDERMPYTFLWWLNKTRKEYEYSHQPFAKANASSFKLDTQKEIKKKDTDDLNHQIAENIFHLRGVEELTENSSQNTTVPYNFRRKEFEIIDKFIKEEPQIKPPAPNKIDTENKAKKSSEDHGEVVSETLAKIYVEQMLYHKALDVYKKLSLKFPEKSTYFASQIKYLELKVN